MKLSTVIGEDLKSRYLAFVIDDASRARLLGLFTPKYERTICHHVTLRFNLSGGLTQSETEMLGKSINVKVVDIRDDGAGVQCLGVSVNGDTIRPDKGFYHITHSLSANRKPAESKMLIDTPPMFVKGIIPVTGMVYLVQK